MTDRATCNACGRTVHPRTVRRHKNQGCPRDSRGRRDVPATPCSVDDCERRATSKGMCGPHRKKVQRHGDPNFEYQRYRRNLTGHRFGLLVALEPAGKAHWLCRCDCGTRHPVRTWCLTSGGTLSCGDGKHWRRAGNYGAVHARIRRLKGRAADHSCTDCGSKARHWSYDHDDPNELRSEDGLRYSLAPNHYQPRCVPCHSKFDRFREVA